MINDKDYLNKFQTHDFYQGIYTRGNQNVIKDFQGYTFQNSNYKNQRIFKIKNFYQHWPYPQSFVNKFYLQNLKPFQKKFSDLNFIFNNKESNKGHFQLSQEIKFLSSQSFITHNKNYLKIYSLPEFKSRNVYVNQSLIYTTDFQKQNSLVSIVDDKFKITLLNLTQNTNTDLSDFYPINNIVGRAVFHKKNQNKISISGNSNYLSQVDLTAMQRIKVTSDYYINNHCYSEDEKLISFCLDTKHTQVKDLLSDDSIKINLNSTYQLASQFINDKTLAVSYIDQAHQKSFINLIDLRRPQKEFQKLQTFSVSKQLLYLPDKKLLLSADMNLGMDFIKLDQALHRDYLSLHGSVTSIGYDNPTSKIITGYQNQNELSEGYIMFDAKSCSSQQIINQLINPNGKDQQHYSM